MSIADKVDKVRPIYFAEREFVVEVYSNGSYRNVCRDTWDHREASVVCRQLNISDGKYFAKLFNY